MTIRKWFTTSVCLFCMYQGSFAASLGVVGDTFPVEEVSFLMFIESRLKDLAKTGELRELQSKWVSNASIYANRPKPLGLRRATKNSHYRYEPVIVLTEDLTDDKGHVFFKKGARVNALDQMSLYQPHWLLFNGDDDAQVRWAIFMLQRYPDARVILTGGEIGKMEGALNTAIYFDQAGRITNQLGIRRVPAHVSREGRALKISEVAVGEDGYAR